MANRLNMADVSAIRSLLERGWSHRRIARELGIHRETVSRYARSLAQAEGSTPGEVTDGDGTEDDSAKPAKVTPGSDRCPDPKPAKVTPGSALVRSLCAPHRQAIVDKLELGLSAQRIYQDLSLETDFDGSYQSVKRFVRRLGATTPLPFRRLEVPPGQEAQVDYGKGAFVDRAGTSRRRPHLFRIVLSHSRKAYSEVVWRQTTESFIRCLENAFRAFCGVPATLVIDNLKAAVTQADWFDPVIHPKFQSFARHYGFAILPTRPYTPRHKGKVEAGIDFAQENALKGRTFATLEEQNRFLDNWERQVADTRIHGTTRKQVRDLFEQEERPSLTPLPVTAFPCFEEGERKVHRDGHVAVGNAYYSAPPEYVGRPVWVRWDERTVRIYSAQFEQIAIHPKIDPGRFQTHPSHIDPRKTAVIEKGAAYLLKQIERIGASSAAWSQALVRRRGVEGIRTLQGFLALTHTNAASELERVTRIALDHEVFRLKSIRRLLAEPAAPEQLSFLEEHPVIRDLSEYEQVVHDAIANRREAP